VTLLTQVVPNLKNSARTNFDTRRRRRFFVGVCRFEQTDGRCLLRLAPSEVCYALSILRVGRPGGIQY